MAPRISISQPVPEVALNRMREYGEVETSVRPQPPADGGWRGAQPLAVADAIVEHIITGRATQPVTG